MTKYALLFTALGLVAFLAVLHFVAIAFSFYWTIWWFDSMMHLLAGFSGGLIILWFSRSFGRFESVIAVLASVMFVGIVWEIFEYLYDVVQVREYWQDTILDLVADGIGAILACFYASGQSPKSS